MIPAAYYLYTAGATLGEYVHYVAPTRTDN